jgi:glycosyltransferase involved in cell wall biosynthesis
VGSIERRKGQDMLIKAVRSLPPDMQDKISLHFIGRIVDTNYSLGLARQMKSLTAHVYGEISRSETLALLKAASLFVCSSRDETGPLTVIEAVSMGVPVVSSEVGFVTKYVRDRETGLTYPQANWRKLAEKLQFAFENPAEMESMARIATKNSKKELNWTRFVDEFEHVVTDCLP